MAWLNQVRLPSEFQEVEYIASSGTQRIDTGVAPDDTRYGILGKFRTSGGQVLIDLSNTTSADNKRYGFQFNGLKPQWSGIMYQSRGEDNGTIDANTDYEFSYNYNGNASFTVNGITKTGIPTGSATMPNFNIFCQNCNGSYQRFWTGRLYRLQLYHNEDKLRDFIPCYRKSDGVIGMYDLVNNVFYTNQGTGTFTKGNDVPNMIEEQIYPAGRKPGKNTVAYYPFRSDILDHSGNNKNFTGSGYSFANNMITTTSELIGPIVTPENTIGDRTINIWCNRNNVAGYSFRGSNNGTDGYLNAKDGENGNRPGASFKPGNWYRNRPSESDLPTMGDVILMTWTKTGDTMKLYIDGVLTSTTTLNTSTRSSAYGITKSSLSPGTYGEIIIEDRIRTPDEIEKYYNDTKRIYNPPIKPWTPGANTLAYIPLDSTNTKNDTYGGNTTTQLGTVRYGTYGGVDCADFTTGGCIYSNMLNGVSTYTVLIWANNINGNSASGQYGGNVVCCSKPGVSYQPGIYYGNSSSSNGYFAFYANNSSGDIYFNTNTKNHWFLLAMCISSSTKKAYLFGDGSYKELDISNSSTNSQYIQIGSTIYDNLTERTDRRFYGYLSNLIIENKVWTATEISNYYNDTKEKYLGSWTPGANTIAYYPLTDDFSDHKGSGTAYDLTNNGGSLTTFNGVKCAYYSGSTSVYSSNTSASVGATRTISCWAFLNTALSVDIPVVWTGAYNTSYRGNCAVLGYGSNTGFCSLSDYVATGINGSTNLVSLWVNLVGIVDGTDMKLYVNGNLINSTTRNYSTTSSTGVLIGHRNGGVGSQYFKGYVNEVIVEDKARTAQEILDYYNQTKSNYGL